MGQILSAVFFTGLVIGIPAGALIAYKKAEPKPGTVQTQTQKNIQTVAKVFWYIYATLIGLFFMYGGISAIWDADRRNQAWRE